MFDIFNIRKCREMREVIEQLTVNLSSERRKYNKATELLDVAKEENSILKLERDELSVKVANLGRKLSEEVGKNDEHSRMVNTLNADLKKVNSALDESLARRDELSREIEKLTASNNSLKERNRFLANKITRHNGYFDEERKELKTKICDLKNENDSLRKEKCDVVFEKFRLKRKAERREHMLEKMCKIHGEFFVHVYFVIFRNDPDDCYYKMSAVLNHFGTTKKTFFQHFGNIFELATVNGVKTNVISKKTLFAFLKDKKQKIVEFISKQAMLSREIEIKESEAK